MKIEISRTISVNGQSITKTASAEITDKSAGTPGFVEELLRKLFNGLQ